MTMYSKWLDEDNEEIDISDQQLKELQEQLKETKEALNKHSATQSEKSKALEEKENRLHVCIYTYLLPAQQCQVTNLPVFFLQISRPINSKFNRSNNTSRNFQKF